MKTFRDFFNEMSLRHSIVEPHPMPQSAANVLSFMPNDSAQKAALVWMLNKGIYDATRGRHKLAEIASKKLGRHVDDLEIFSQAAHQADPQLANLYNTELKPLWDSQLEPKKIPILDGDDETYVNLGDLNKTLQTAGKSPFSFGGYNGLLEFLENGKWSKPIALHTPTKGKDYHLRHGLDLSNPEFLHDKTTGKYFYRFGSQTDPEDRYMPPHDPSSYGSFLDNMHIMSSREIQKVLNNKESNVSPEFQQWIQNNRDKIINREIANANDSSTSTAKTNMNFATRGTGRAAYIDAANQNDFDNLQKIVLLGIQEVNKDKKQAYKGGSRKTATGYDSNPEFAPWTEEHIQKMMKEIFHHGKGLKVAWKATDPLVKELVHGFYRQQHGRGWKQGDMNDRNYRLVKQFIDKGLPLFKQQSNDVPEDLIKTIRYYSKDVPYQDFMKKPKYDKVTIDLQKDILDQGYQMPPGKSLENDWSIRFQKGSGEYIIADKSQDGTWTARKVVSEDPAKNQNWTGAPIIVQSGNFPSNRAIVAEVDPETRKHINHSFMNSPETYGDKVNKKGFPASIDQAVKTGRAKAFQYFGISNDDIRKKYSDEQLLGLAWEAMQKLYGTYAFKFGDPEGRFSKKDVNDTKYNIYTTLAKHGVEDKQQATDYVKTFYSFIDSGKEPRVSPSFPQNVYDAFLENGWWWRAMQAGLVVANKLSKEIQSSFRQRSNQEIQGSDGKNIDTLSQSSEDEQKQGLANRAKFATGEEEGGKGGRIKKISGQDQFTSVKPDDILGNAEIRNREQENASALDNVFSKTSIAKNNSRSDAGSSYGIRYRFTQKLLNNMQGNPSQSIHAALERTIGSGASDPERNTASIDAIGDFLGNSVNTAVQEKDVNNLANLLVTFIVPKSDNYLAKFCTPSQKPETEQFLRKMFDRAKDLPPNFQQELGKKMMEIQDRKVPATVTPPQAAPTQQPQPAMAAWSSDDIVDTKPNLTMHPPLRVGSHVFNSPEEFKKMLNMARGSKHEPVLRNAALASKNPAYTRLLEPEVLRKVEQMMSFTEWKNFKLLDSLKETEAVYDGSKSTTFLFPPSAL
jgi:hypothetical protein